MALVLPMFDHVLSISVSELFLSSMKEVSLS